MANIVHGQVKKLTKLPEWIELPLLGGEIQARAPERFDYTFTFQNGLPTAILIKQAVGSGLIYSGILRAIEGYEALNTDGKLVSCSNIIVNDHSINVTITSDTQGENVYYAVLS